MFVFLISVSLSPQSVIVMFAIVCLFAKKTFKSLILSPSLSSSSDDRTKEKQAEVGLSWIKCTPREPSHATPLMIPCGGGMPWVAFHQYSRLIQARKLRFEMLNSTYCYKVAHKPCQDAKWFSSGNTLQQLFHGWKGPHRQTLQITVKEGLFCILSIGQNKFTCPCDSVGFFGDCGQMQRQDRMCLLLALPS